MKKGMEDIKTNQLKLWKVEKTTFGMYSSLNEADQTLKKRMSVNLKIQPYTIHHVNHRKREQGFSGLWENRKQDNTQAHDTMKQIKYLRKKQPNFFQIC